MPSRLLRLPLLRRRCCGPPSAAIGPAGRRRRSLLAPPLLERCGQASSRAAMAAACMRPWLLAATANPSLSLSCTPAERHHRARQLQLAATAPASIPCFARYYHGRGHGCCNSSFAAAMAAPPSLSLDLSLSVTFSPSRCFCQAQPKLPL